MKAVITPDHLRGKSIKAGLTSIQHQIQSVLNAKGVNSFNIRKTENQIIVPIGLPRKELDSILSKSNVPYSIEYIEADKLIIKKSESKVPEDYGHLKGQVKQQTTKISQLETELYQTSETLKNEKIKSSGLQASLNETKARYGDMNVTDFLAEMMLRENKSWESFTSSYQEALEMSSEMYNIPIGELEQECLDYQPLTNNLEFQKIKENFENAQQAQTLSKKNKYINLDTDAKEILEKGHKIIEKDKAVSELRRELSAYASQRAMRIAVNIKGDEMNITLPFKIKQEYGIVEGDLVKNINNYLKSSESKYTQEEFHGLLRYNISGIKKRARDKLITEITSPSSEDNFSKLCIQRQAVRVETC